MAKRKRLEMPAETVLPDLETKSAFPAPRARMPIADVAGETAGRAALEEVAREMTAAEDEGRVVVRPPGQIALDPGQDRIQHLAAAVDIAQGIDPAPFRYHGCLSFEKPAA